MEQTSNHADYTRCNVVSHDATRIERIEAFRAPSRCHWLDVTGQPVGVRNPHSWPEESREVKCAETEAQQIIAKAKVDAADMVTRRGKMAEDKIAAAEASAIADVRAKIAGVSAIAAEQIIAGQASAATDAALIDQAISALN